MLNFIKGYIVGKDEGVLVVECNGIGYEILVPTRLFSDLPDIGKEVKLFVKFILKESEAILVGFLKEDERRVFDLLTSVSGVGVKQSLRILSELSVNDIRQAIVLQNEKAFASVKGIGSKLASRIVLELGDKIKKIEVEGATGVIESLDKKKLEVLMALRVLGYSDFEAKKAIEGVFADKEVLKDMDVEGIIKRVLTSMVR